MKDQKKSPIVLLDDDDDEREILEAVVKGMDIDREVRYFKTGDDLIQYLLTSEAAPAIIIADVMLGGETAFDVKMCIMDNGKIRYKSVPFIMWSTNATETHVKKAYDSMAQGFFEKPASVEMIDKTLKMILEYWQCSKHPKRII